MYKKLISIVVAFVMVFGMTTNTYALDCNEYTSSQDSEETKLEVEEDQKEKGVNEVDADADKADEDGIETSENTEEENQKTDVTDEAQEDNSIADETETVSANEIIPDDGAEEIIEDDEKEADGSGTEELMVSTKLEVDPIVYLVSFPSVEQFDFFLDPYGLRGLKELGSASLEDLRPYAGKVYCDNKMMVTNKSSVPIKLKISIQLMGDVNAVETVEELEADGENNILMYIVPSENDMEGNLDNYKPSGSGIVISKDKPTVVELLLPQSSYYYKEIEEGSMQYIISEEDSGHSSAFKIGGYVNTKADWGSFGTEKKVGLEIRYSYEDASSIPSQYSSEIGLFGIQYYDGAVIDISNEM